LRVNEVGEIEVEKERNVCGGVYEEAPKAPMDSTQHPLLSFIYLKPHPDSSPLAHH